MKYIGLIVLIGLLMLSACKTGPTGDVVMQDKDTKVTVNEVDDKTTTMTVESDDGNAKIEVKEGTDSWCAAGSEWKMTGDQGNAQWNIEGIVASGKYKGYCHVTYDIASDDTQANMDYYFKEDGSGYQVMEVNGQKFESQWTGSS